VGCAGTAWILIATSPSFDSWQGGVSVFLICFAAYALIAIPFNLLSLRKWSRIRREAAPASRWIVPATEWNRFVANERSGIANKTLLPNLVDLGMHVPAGGIEIAVAADAVVVGPELHRLRAFTVRAYTGPHHQKSDPPTWEYRVTLVAGDDTYYDSTIRFPSRPA
jgi:hypothetical protein